MSMVKTAALYTLGCRVNQYESEAMAEELIRLGFTIRPFQEVCDCYLINTCAVTEESTRKSRQMVRRAKKRNPEALVAVCGCASQLEPEKLWAETGADVVAGTRNKRKIIEAIAQWSQTGEKPALCLSEPPTGELEDFSISAFPRARAYIKIQDGCNGKCAYCVIRKVRGPSVSRDPADVLSEVRRIAESGTREVVLTGIETAAYAYGLDSLIRAAAEIPGIERIRLGSLDPAAVTPSLIDSICGIPAFMPHIHLSLQSGSDRILRLMRRRYTADTVRERVAYLRSRLPSLQLSADLITGFPGETEADFEETRALARDLDLLHGHVFTYSARPGTEAAEMPEQVPEKEKSRRLTVLTDQCEAQKTAILDRILREQQTLQVLAEEETHGRYLGHTPNFAEAAFPAQGCPDLRGKIVTVVPERQENGQLIGKIKSGG